MDGAQICRLLENGRQIEQHGLQLDDTLTRGPSTWQWVNLTWGSSLVTWELYKWGGYAAVVVFYHAFLAATFFFLYLTFARCGVRVITAVSLCALIFIFFQLHFRAATYVFSYAFLAGLIYVYRTRRMPVGTDWFCLPLMFLAWGNMDHGWVCGAFFILISLLGRWLDLPVLPRRQTEEGEEPEVQEERPAMKEIRLWLRLVFLCILCAFINPFVALLGNPVSFWSEANRVAFYADDVPDFSGPSRPAIAILLIVVGTLATRFIPNGRPPSCEYGLPLFLFLVLSLKGQDQTWLFVLVAAVPIAQELDYLLDRFLGRVELFNCSERILTRWQSQARGDLPWTAVFCLVLAAVWLRSPASAGLSANGRLISPNLLAFLSSHRDHLQRPFTSAEVGSSVYWFLDGTKVSLDDRREIYKIDYFGPVGPIYQLGPGWSRLMQEGGFDSAIIASGFPINNGLGTVPGWKQAYQDSGVTVFYYDPPPGSK